MSLDTTGILDGIVSHALSLGVFSRVNAHEPKSAPGTGITAAVWCDTIAPYQGDSGLTVTSGVVTFKVRLYTNMLAEPADMIDPAMMNAVDLLMTAYSGDFDLGGAIRNVDLLGATGRALSAQAGYLSQDGRLLRIMDLVVPCVVSNLWLQAS
jgi:hypothetical protein